MTTGSAPKVTRFPPAPPEPEPLPLRARLLRVAVVAVAVVAVVAAAVLVPHLHRSGSGRRSTTAAPAPPPGHVVVLDGLHLSITSTRGTWQRALTGDLAVDPQSMSLQPDPGRRQAVTQPGFGVPARSAQRVELGAATSAAVPALPADLLARGALAPEPWADGGRSMVLLTGAVPSAISLVDVGSGRNTPLGTAAASAAGVPSTAAAVVATGGALLPHEGDVDPVATSSRIELRRPGRPPVVLHTDRQLASEGGFPPGEPLVIDRLSVSPDARHLLVAFDLAGTHQYPQGTFNPPRIAPAGAMVLLDLEGRIEAVRATAAGRGLDWVRWSTAGTLALGELVGSDAVNSPGHALTYWDPNGAPKELALPGALDNTLQTPCAWSPPADRLLCGDDRGWYDVDVRSGNATRISGVTGRPLVWLP